VYTRLVRGGTVIATSGCSAVSFSDTPGAGTHAYYLQVRADTPSSFGNPANSVSGTASERSLMVMETKR
jgi:hypothetical protein